MSFSHEEINYFMKAQSTFKLKRVDMVLSMTISRSTEQENEKVAVRKGGHLSQSPKESADLGVQGGRIDIRILRVMIIIDQ